VTLAGVTNGQFGTRNVVTASEVRMEVSYFTEMTV